MPFPLAEDSVRIEADLESSIARLEAFPPRVWRNASWGDPGDPGLAIDHPRNLYTTIPYLYHEHLSKGILCRYSLQERREIQLKWGLGLDRDDGTIDVSLPRHTWSLPMAIQNRLAHTLARSTRITDAEQSYQEIYARTRLLQQQMLSQQQSPSNHEIGQSESISNSTQRTSGMSEISQGSKEHPFAAEVELHREAETDSSGITSVNDFESGSKLVELFDALDFTSSPESPDLDLRPPSPITNAPASVRSLSPSPSHITLRDTASLTLSRIDAGGPSTPSSLTNAAPGLSQSLASSQSHLAPLSLICSNCSDKDRQCDYDLHQLYNACSPCYRDRTKCSIPAVQRLVMIRSTLILKSLILLRAVILDREAVLQERDVKGRKAYFSLKSFRRINNLYQDDLVSIEDDTELCMADEWSGQTRADRRREWTQQTELAMSLCERARLTDLELLASCTTQGGS